MTATLSRGGLLAESRMSRRGRALTWAAVLLGIAVLLLVVRRSSGEGRPLDPDGTGPLGVKALVLLLDEGGADVRVSARPPSPDRRTAIVLRDTFDQARADAIMAWVRGGGTLVVTDPTSPLTQAKPFLSPVPAATGARDLREDCPAIPALGAITSIRTGDSLVYDLDGRAPGAVGCFSTDEGDWLVATPVGDGTVVALGGAGPFVNARLDEADAAGLAMALLAPTPGTPTQIVSDLAPDAGEIGVDAPAGDDGLFAGLPARARVAGIQLLVVFLGAALWRGRRLGRPVDEDPPVEIPGSELVVAVGNLYQKGRHRRRAAEVLVAQARRTVTDRLGLPRGTDPRTIAEVASARTGVPAERVAAAVDPPDPADDEALVALARSTEALAAALAHPPDTHPEQA